jgi:hypothetical protein
MMVNGEEMVADVIGLSENGYLLVKKDGKSLEIPHASKIKILRLS